MNILEKIALENLSKVLVTYPAGQEKNSAVVKKFMQDISQFGYTLDKNLVTLLKTLPKEQIKDIHSTVVAGLSVMLGYNVRYVPLFKNFPDTPVSEDFINSRTQSYMKNLYNKLSSNYQALDCGHIVSEDFVLHQYGACPLCGHQVADLMEMTSKPLAEVTPLKVLTLCRENVVLDWVRTLMTSGSAWNQSQKDIISEVFKLKGEEAIALLPKEIKVKENATTISQELINLGQGSVEVKPYIKTATDVLRLACSLSGGDVSLAEDSKFKLGRRHRRIIMELLNEIENPLEDMKRYVQKWTILAHHLHIGDKQKHYTSAYDAISVIRNKPRSIKTFDSKVEEALKSKNTNHIVNVLKERPGIFARRLHQALTVTSEDSKVITAFSEVASSLTNSLLLSLKSYFSSRAVQENRYITPKGNIAKLKVMPNPTALSENTYKAVVDILDATLKAKYVSKHDMKVVYLDPSLKEVLAPIVMRDSSKSLKTLTRGSQVKLDAANTYRMFLYWKENEAARSVDVDLSTMVFDKDWKYKTHISFTQLASSGATHSGDVRSAPNGASEFIDIPVEKFKALGLRYVVMSVWSYSSVPFSKFECFAGLMKRDKPDSGEIFEAASVEHKFDLVGDTTANIPLVLDLEEMKLVWCDVSLAGRTAEGNKNSVVLMSKAISDYKNVKPNLFDTLSLQLEASGVKIEYKKNKNTEYDMCFDMEWAKDIVNINANFI